MVRGAANGTGRVPSMCDLFSSLGGFVVFWKISEGHAQTILGKVLVSYGLNVPIVLG
jgi:hypothetical protein